MGISNFRSNNNTPNNEVPNTGLPTGPIGQTSGYDDEEREEILDMLINYNQKYKTANPILFRDDVVNQTMSALIGKDKPNALLIGSAGVGKTKIVEDIARRIENKDPYIPNQLSDKIIYELPLSNIVAGSGIVGVLETKMKNLIAFLKNPKEKAILFIDEIHLIQTSETYEKIAQILKPAMARGDIKVIGSTTNTESTELAKDPAFNRRFSRIIVDELTINQTEEILEMSLASYILHYNSAIVIDKSIIPYIVRTASQYGYSGNHRPDNALTLLDRACADTIIARKIAEEKLKNDPAMLNALRATPNIVTEKRVKSTAIKLMTGSSKSEIIEKDSIINKMAKIKGQDEIVDAVIKKVLENNNNYFPKTTPLTILFAGPSGVGKSEIAKILGEEVTNEKPIILNLTEYNNDTAIHRIIGAPAGFVGYSDKHELPFDKLETNPYQVILLDEFEKASKGVQRLFMQIFNEGRLKLSDGRELDFGKAIIIATTNAGQTNYKKNTLGFGNKTENKIAKTLDNLKVYFDIELLNRFELILEFNHISKDTYAEIMGETYEREVARIKSEFKRVTIPDTIDPNTLNELVEKSYHKDFGARPVYRTIKDYIQEII